MLGGEPHFGVSDKDECLTVCADDPECGAVDFNESDSAYLGAHCWIHKAPVGEAIRNENGADHYKKQ